MAIIKKEPKPQLVYHYPRTPRPTIKKAIRLAVRAKYDGHCAYCGDLLSERFYVDHITSVYNGGSHDIDNLNPACFICNSWKTAQTIEQFRHEIQMQVERARKYSRNYRFAEKFGLVKEIKQDVIFCFEKYPERGLGLRTTQGLVAPVASATSDPNCENK